MERNPLTLLLDGGVILESVIPADGRVKRKWIVAFVLSLLPYIVQLLLVFRLQAMLDSSVDDFIRMSELISYWFAASVGAMSLFYIAAAIHMFGISRRTFEMGEFPPEGTSLPYRARRVSGSKARRTAFAFGIGAIINVCVAGGWLWAGFESLV